MSDPPEQSQPPRIREGVVCVQCGYDLSGLEWHDHAVCPECGHRTEGSLAGPLLRNEGEGWLDRVGDGLFLTHTSLYDAVIYTIGLLVLMPFLAMIIMLPFNVLGSDDVQTSVNDYVGFIGGAVILFVILRHLTLAAIGVRKTTAPNSNSDHNSDDHWRRWARAFPFILLTVTVIAISELFWSAQSLPGRLIESIAVGAVTVILWISFHGLRRHLAELDGRCLGKRALPVPRDLSMFGIAIRFVVVALVSALSFVSKDDFQFAIPVTIFLFAWIFLMRRFRLVCNRVVAELIAIGGEDKGRIKPS